MDEMTTNTMAPDDAALDAAWDDESDLMAVEEADQPEQTAEEPAQQEQQSEQGAEPGEQQANQPEDLFTLTHLGQQKQVTRAEVTALAQKGMDYDRIRQRYDALQTEKQQAEPALALVRAYAQRNNMDVTQYIDFCRQQELMSTGMSEQNALQTVRLEKQKAELDARQAAADAEQQQKNSVLAQAKAKQEQQRQDMTQFIKDHPDIKAEDIPVEVWAKVREGQNLTVAYTMYENQKLKNDLAAERQNNQNKQNAVGSLRNPQREEDDIDRIWDEDD